MIKEAAKRLLDKGKITQAEYDHIEKVAAMPLKSPKQLQDLIELSVKRAIQGSAKSLKGIKFPDPVPPTMFQKVLEVAKPVAFTAGALGGAALVGKEIAGQIGTQIGIGNSFNQMQEKVPQLQQYDKEDMRDYFNVIKTYSPKAASNPLVAGALVHKMMMMGGVDHKLVQDISQIETKPRSGLVFDIAATTAKSLAGMPTFGTGEGGA